MKNLHLEFETPYQVTPLTLSNGRTVHGIAISADAGQARVLLDPNSCQLDHFGDRGICTMMAVPPFETKLSLLEERDGEQLFAFEQRDAGEPSLRLVLHRDRHGHIASCRLLVLDAAGAIKAVVALERSRRK